MNLLDWLGGQVEGAFAQANPWDNGADYNSVQQRRRKEEQARAQRPPRAPQVGVNAVRPLSVQSTPLPKVSQAQISQRSVANQFNPLKTVGDVAGGIGKGINDVATAVGGFVLPGTAKLTNQTLGIIENTGANIAGETQKLFGDKKGGQNTIDSVKRHVDQNLLGQGKGLFGQGGIYNSTDSLHNANPTEVLKKAGGTGLEVAGELLPVARVAKGPTLGAKIANNAIAGAVSNTLADVGSQYVQNGTVNPWQTAQSAAIGGAFGGAIPVVGAAVKPVGTKLVQTGQRAQNFGLLPPTKLTPEELFAAKKMRQAQQGLIDPRTVTTQDAILNNRAEKKLGQSPGTPQAWHEVNRALDAHRAFNVEVAQRAQAVKDGLTTANDFTREHLVPGGTLDPGWSKSRTDIQNSLAKALDDGTTQPVNFGKLDRAKFNRVNELLTARGLEPMQSPDVLVHPAVVEKLRRNRINIDGMTPEQVADIAYSAVHNKKSKVYQSTNQKGSAVKIMKSKTPTKSHDAYVGEFDGSGSLKTVYPGRNKLDTLDGRAVPSSSRAGEPALPRQAALSDLQGNSNIADKSGNVNGRAFSASTPRSPKGLIDKRLVEAAKRERVVDFDPATNEDALKMFNVVNDDILKQIKSALNNSSAKERGFIETIINDPHTAQHIKDNVTSLYNVRNTKDLQIRAKNLVKDSPDLAQRVAEAGNGDVSVAVGSELLKHLQKNGNYETALDLADKLAKQGTEAGRTAQAFSIYGKLTPSGVLRFAQRTIKQYNDANNLAPGKQLKLTPQQAKSLTDKSTALWKMPEGRAKDIATKELVGEIYKLVPSSWAAKISTGQTMAQLLNPKTAIRNVLGNTLFGGVDNISQVLASGIDKATSKVRGSARTTALPSAKAQLGGLKSGAKQAIEEINKGVNLGPNTQFELGDVPTFRGGIMGGLEKTMSYELRVPDRAAYQAAFDDTVHGLMKANKLDKPTAEILEQANANGLYKTFQDNSTAAKLFVKSKEALNHVGIEGKDGKRFGLGDLLLKYPKTPGNILARGLDYSPVGIVKGLTQIVKPAITGKPFNQHTFANSIARGTVGTGAIIGAGAVLGGLGIITEAPNEDTDARNLQKASGQGGYQINVDALRRYLFSGFDSDEAKLKEGDTLVSYDWAQPMSIPLSAGAAIGKKQNPGDAAISTVSNAANGLNTLIEQPLVSGLNTFFNNVKNKGVVGAAGETAKGAPASFVPTASNQTRQLTDNTTRSTYDPRLYGLVQSLNMVANKIPGASYLLHPQVDTLGNDKQNYQNGSNNLLNVAFNPAFVNKYQPDSAAKLPLGIMNDTGETKQIPTTTKTTQKVNGENMQLTAQQNEDFQRYVGLKTRDYLETASKDKQFMSLNQQDQATRISQAISNIQQAARVQVLGGNSDNADKNVKNILTTGAATLNTKAVSSGVSSVDINDKIASEYKDTLNKYSSDDDRKKWFNSENDAEYKYNLAKYENAKANGTLSTADDIRTKRSVYKDKVGSSYSKNVREMYTLSKTELADYLNTEDGTDKAKLYDELYAYDRALYDAGLVSSLKFKYGFASGSKSGKKGGKKGNGVTEGKAMVSLARQLNKLTTPKTTGSKSPAAGIKLPQLKKTALRKYTVKTAKVQKAAKPLKIKTSKA